MNAPSTCFAAIVAAHGLLKMTLAWRVIRFRQTQGVSLGDGGHSEGTRRIRAHANFTEWVPLPLLALLVADLRGAGPIVVGAIGGALLLGRILHAYGLSSTARPNPWRIVGMVLTMTALLAACAGAVISWGSGPA